MGFLGLFNKHAYVPYRVDDVFLDGDKIGIVESGRKILLVASEDRRFEALLGVFKVLLARIQKLEAGQR